MGTSKYSGLDMAQMLLSSGADVDLKDEVRLANKGGSYFSKSQLIIAYYCCFCDCHNSMKMGNTAITNAAFCRDAMSIQRGEQSKSKGG